MRQQKRTSASSLEPNLRTGDEIFLQNVFNIIITHTHVAQNIFNFTSTRVRLILR